MALAHSQLAPIVAAVLAVNNFKLDRAWALMPAFESAGLLDPEQVADRDLSDLTPQVFAAGFQRGLLTEMMAGRVRDVMRAAQAGKLDGLSACVASGDREGAVALLCTVKGIGPKVAGDAWMLMT